MRVNTGILQNLRERGQVNFVETKPKSSDPIQVIKNDSSQVTSNDKEYTLREFRAMKSTRERNSGNDKKSKLLG